MKKHVVTLVVLLALLAGGALTVQFGFRAPSVSFKLLEYTRWPGGAMLRLTNGTPSTISYLAEQNGLPSGAPILRLLATLNGWSNVSTKIKTVRAFLGTTGKSNQIFVLGDPAAPPKPGQFEFLSAPRIEELTPGSSVDFYVRLEPGDPPIRVGTICCVPQTRFTKALQPYLARLRQWCGMKPAELGQIEVWCPTTLQLQPSPLPALQN